MSQYKDIYDLWYQICISQFLIHTILTELINKINFENIKQSKRMYQRQNSFVDFWSNETDMISQINLNSLSSMCNLVSALNYRSNDEYQKAKFYFDQYLQIKDDSIRQNYFNEYLAINNEAKQIGQDIFRPLSELTLEDIIEFIKNNQKLAGKTLLSLGYKEETYQNNYKVIKLKVFNLQLKLIQQKVSFYKSLKLEDQIEQLSQLLQIRKEYLILSKTNFFPNQQHQSNKPFKTLKQSTLNKKDQAIIKSQLYSVRTFENSKYDTEQNEIKEINQNDGQIKSSIDYQKTDWLIEKSIFLKSIGYLDSAAQIFNQAVQTLLKLGTLPKINTKQLINYLNNNHVFVSLETILVESTDQVIFKKLQPKNKLFIETIQKQFIKLQISRIQNFDQEQTNSLATNKYFLSQSKSLNSSQISEEESQGEPIKNRNPCARCSGSDFSINDNRKKDQNSTDTFKKDETMQTQLIDQDQNPKESKIFEESQTQTVDFLSQQLIIIRQKLFSLQRTNQQLQSQVLILKHTISCIQQNKNLKKKSSLFVFQTYLSQIVKPTKISEQGIIPLNLSKKLEGNHIIPGNHEELINKLSILDNEVGTLKVIVKNMEQKISVSLVTPQEKKLKNTIFQIHKTAQIRLEPKGEHREINKNFKLHKTSEIKFEPELMSRGLKNNLKFYRAVQIRWDPKAEYHEMNTNFKKHKSVETKLNPNPEHHEFNIENQKEYVKSGRLCERLMKSTGNYLDKIKKQNLTPSKGFKKGHEGMKSTRNIYDKVNNIYGYPSEGIKEVFQKSTKQIQLIETFNIKEGARKAIEINGALARKLNVFLVSGNNYIKTKR